MKFEIGPNLFIPNVIYTYTCVVFYNQNLYFLLKIIMKKSSEAHTFFPKFSSQLFKSVREIDFFFFNKITIYIIQTHYTSIGERNWTVDDDDDIETNWLEIFPWVGGIYRKLHFGSQKNCTT